MIPEEFHSDVVGGAFKHCSICGTELTDKYFVEKVYRRYSNGEKYTAFELAICMDCYLEMMQGISVESRQRMMEFMQSRPHSFTIDLNQANGLPDRCSFTSIPIDELEEYHIVGIFDSDSLVQPPLLVSSQIREEQSEMLSEETKDFFDDFMDKITDLPPDVASILGPKRLSPV